MQNFEITPIGFVQTPYKEKFAVPRQPRLVPSARSRLFLSGEANNAESIREIEQFSHLWLLFLFDQNLDAGWKPTVRPPRLGGNQRIGVFASRSTFRPNGIGMSAVELLGSGVNDKQHFLELGGVDLVDGTPIVDIKPYIPYSDAILDARGGYASEEPNTLEVTFEQGLASSLSQHQMQVIREVLAQDPRPAYKKNRLDNKQYAVKLFDLEIKFQVNTQFVKVTHIEHF